MTKTEIIKIAEKYLEDIYYPVARSKKEALELIIDFIFKELNNIKTLTNDKDRNT